MHNLYQNGTAQSIKDSLTSAPRDDFEVRISTLKEELDGVRQLTKGGGFNTVVIDFKSLTDVTVWVRANLPPYPPKFEHFIDLDIILSGIRQTGVNSEEVLDKEVHAEIAKSLEKKSMVVKYFQRTSPEDWGLSNDKNNFLR